MDTLSWDLLDTLAENRQRIYKQWQDTKTPTTQQDALVLADTIAQYEAADREYQQTLAQLLQD